MNEANVSNALQDSERMSDEHKPEDRDDNSVADSGYGNSLIYRVAETRQSVLRSQTHSRHQGAGIQASAEGYGEHSQDNDIGLVRQKKKLLEEQESDILFVVTDNYSIDSKDL